MTSIPTPRIINGLVLSHNLLRAALQQHDSDEVAAAAAILMRLAQMLAQDHAAEQQTELALNRVKK